MNQIKKKGGLEIRENPNIMNGVHVVDANLIEISSLDEVLELLLNGAINRAVGKTEINEQSL